MPLGGKALKRREQAKDAKNGIVRDELALRKAANAKADVHCTVCAVAFKLTKKNVDQRTHVESCVEINQWTTSRRWRGAPEI